jgi:hypothetical protein
MTMQDTDLSKRLDKLERQLGFWRTLTVLALILCAAGMATHLGATPAWIKTTRVEATAVVAHEFDLVNPSGRITARLVSDPTDPDSPNLVLKYPNDKPAILLGIDSKTGSEISLLNSDGKPRAIMSENATGPSLSLFDEDAKLRMLLHAENQAPEIIIFDKATKKVWVAPTNFLP